MIVSRLRIQNVKSFSDSGYIDFSPSINIFTGHNNSGKSTLLSCIYKIQSSNAVTGSHIRLAQDSAVIELALFKLDENYCLPTDRQSIPGATADIRLEWAAPNANQNPQISIGGGQRSIAFVSQTFPQNLIFPFLSKRKVQGLSEQVSSVHEAIIDDNLHYLTAKIDALRDRDHLQHERYNEYCERTLGFSIGAKPSPNGKQSGLIVKQHDVLIPLESMGEGTTHLVGLISWLCLAKHKVFLIEEPENDVHPEALKELLKLIVESSTSNQFIITTHSNIVLRYLGSVPDSKVFSCRMAQQDGIPTSDVTEVSPDPSSRRDLLESLGYDFDDYYLFKGWLILEESSAERIIAEFLIPWFVPELGGRLRLMAANGISQIEAKFDDFSRLFLFTHLQEIYQDRTWVLVDGDRIGVETVERLRTRFGAKWRPEHFATFNQTAFEHYFPERFHDEAATALAHGDKQSRRELKARLLNNVIEWASTNEGEARAEFKSSFEEVIGHLDRIKQTLGL